MTTPEPSPPWDEPRVVDALYDAMRAVQVGHGWSSSIMEAFLKRMRIAALKPSPSPVVVEPTADQIDAKRYRWLRAGNYPFTLTRSILNDAPHGIDAAVDAAIKRLEEGKS